MEISISELSPAVLILISFVMAVVSSNKSPFVSMAIVEVPALSNFILLIHSIWYFD